MQPKGENIQNRKQAPTDNPWGRSEENPSSEQEKAPATFYEGLVMNPEEKEFKRLTGKEWPGTNSIAGSNGQNDHGNEDGSSATSTIRQRTETEKTSPDSRQSPRKVFSTFEVAPGISKEKEFKRLTGEEWPGINYIAESTSTEDDGYDVPIETWTIYEINPKLSKEPGETAPTRDSIQELNLDPRILNDLTDKLEDIDRWIERDRQNAWRGESAVQNQDHYDHLITEVINQAIAENQALLELEERSDLETQYKLQLQRIQQLERELESLNNPNQETKTRESSSFGFFNRIFQRAA